MYDDNAWPDTAPISNFINERKRPQRVLMASLSLVIAALCNLLVAIMYGSLAESARSGVVSGTPSWTGTGLVVVSALMLVTAAVLASGLARGRRWAPNVSRWMLGVYAAGCGLFGLLANPNSTATREAGFGWLVMFFVVGTMLAGIVGLAGLFGSDVKEYFRLSPQQPVPPMPTGADGGPGGRDSDWIPPQHYGPGGHGPQPGAPPQPGGAPNYPPPPGYGPPPGYQPPGGQNPYGRQ